MTNRMASRPFVVRAGLGLLVLAALGLYLGTRFRVGIDSQVQKCLPPYSVWLIDRHDRALVRGATYGFFAGDSMAPFFGPGQRVVKRLRGLPGDQVTVTSERTTVNGVTVGTGLALAATLHQPPDAFARQVILPNGAVWLMGDTPDSFDSRYWGPLAIVQIGGRAYALF
ncbi:S26 family signal peptidase [uncultured Thiodictyon sp.]|uniref:S26 family signal peptidase n=1 Tax=uncultured Thiodictyon sp. TaxID=1846217 RepID=UPI0025E44D92|nr:S26 family signal peptidase [uncultured Thiodictyon sp.]